MTYGRHVAAALVLGALALLAAGPASVGAIYARPDLENVPVARLVANLERELAARPKDPDIHLRLARLYAMAYSANAEALPVTVLAGADKEPKQEVWFGHEPNLVPRVAPGVTRTAAAKAYLQKSIGHYKTAVELNPSGLAARMGHAWALEQSGNKAGAVAEYRRVIDQAWPKEQNSKFAQLGQRFYTEEAAGYLVPLLDPAKDAPEIAELRKKMEGLQRIPRPVTPIAIPLSDTAALKTIVDLDAVVPFDADGTGLRRTWTWISPDAAGWLVYDAAGRGRITSALQWFGGVTFWAFWTNGYDALRSLDDNGDGELRGAELRHLAIWRDANKDGVSDPGEVRALAEYGIVALSCRATAGDGILAAARSDAGVRFSDGRVRPTFDVILRRSISVSVP